jgi:hypothetical protein
MGRPCYAALLPHVPENSLSFWPLYSHQEIQLVCATFLVVLVYLLTWLLSKQALDQFASSVHTHCELHSPLGPWPASSVARWKWFYSPMETHLYHKEGPLLVVFLCKLLNSVHN